MYGPQLKGGKPNDRKPDKRDHEYAANGCNGHGHLFGVQRLS
jgi:hypothetical protein